MPKRLLDRETLQSEILIYISRHGVSSSQSLCQHFKISQPTLSRIISANKNELLMLGKGRSSKYAARRHITDTAMPTPIYEILEDGSSRQFGILNGIKPNGFYFEAKTHDAKSNIYNDLPYFLNDMRPGGFLGRLIPFQNEDLHLPQNIYMWTAEHCLKYLSQRGWNTVGNLIIGDKAFQLYLEKSQANNGIESKKREEQYPLYANDVLAVGDPGSSAGGEHPKFTTLLLPENKHVLVKFSPFVNTEIGQRVADILICEHIALRVLKKNACDATDSELLIYDNRVFLEVNRFDRIGKLGRRGLISLGTLDAEFAGAISTWSKTAEELTKNQIIPEHLLEKILFREIFGELIANTDMHLYNLSFFTRGEMVTDLAPVYDMAPMLFAPRNNQIIEKEFKPALPSPQNTKIWISAHAAACQFWNEVLKDTRISESFKSIAVKCQNRMSELVKLTKLLPI